MKVKYKKPKQLVIGLFMAIAMFLAPAVATTETKALECGILPQSLCESAKNKSEGCGDVNDKSKNCVKNTGIYKLLLMVINTMTAGLAILATGGIIYGAVLYSSAGPNQGQIVKAKQVLLNVVLGIVAFGLMYGFLQWLIPGGVFNA